ncbi:MAG TPA: bacterioferritin [Firmicutes bacterium]|jgi:bacterioferritin|nr:bacterioferritin [Bacillota bacterium]
MNEEQKNKVIELLNKAMAMELQSVHQYMHQHFKLDDMDYGELAKNVKLIAIDEMRHAESLGERIKELGGDPISEPAGPIIKGQDLKEIFSFDAGEEEDAIKTYTEFAKLCREYGDALSAVLFEGIIEHEQEHYNYFNNVDTHLDNLGDVYLARMAGTDGDIGKPKGFVVKG